VHRKLAILAAALLLLTGCQRGNAALQSALDLRASLNSAGGCSYRAEITAQYPDADRKFSGSCRFKTDGGAEMTLTEPATIAGITASVTKDGANVSFEDTAVAFGSLAEGNLAPMAIPYVLGSSWAGAYIASAGTEDGSVHVVYEKGYGDGQLRVDTWLSAADGEPELAEITYDGQKTASVRLSEFSLD
jgi:hypothetical protein